MRAGMAVANVMVEEGGMRAAAGASGDRPAGGTAHATGGGAYTARPRRATDGGRPTYKEWGRTRWEGDGGKARWKPRRWARRHQTTMEAAGESGSGAADGRDQTERRRLGRGRAAARCPARRGPAHHRRAHSRRHGAIWGEAVRGCHWIRRPGILAQRALIGLWSLDDSGRNESGPSHNESVGTIPCPRPDPPPAAAARAPRRFAAVAVRQSAVCGAACRRDEGARW